MTELLKLPIYLCKFQDAEQAKWETENIPK